MNEKKCYIESTQFLIFISMRYHPISAEISYRYKHNIAASPVGLYVPKLNHHVCVQSLNEHDI